jgi:hypothetical protein
MERNTHFSCLFSPSTQQQQLYQFVNILKKNSMEEPISGIQAAYAILGDSMVELLSVVCAACLAILLNQPANKAISDFSTQWYRVSTGILPMILSLYFHKKQMGCTAGTNETEQEQFLLFLQEQQTNGGDSNDNNDHTRGFPVVFIFQIIVSCCLFFMKFQAQQQQKNVEMVLQLKQAVDETKDKKKKK